MTSRHRCVPAPDVPPGDLLPRGVTLRLERSVRVRQGGRTLIGGAPPRVTRLSPAAMRLMRSGRIIVDGAASRRLAEHLLIAGMASPDPDTLAAIPAREITCVVPVKDRADGLHILLARLCYAFRVIVVDDASQDPKPIADAATQHGARLLRLPRNLGPAGARNAGLAAVDTPYVAFIDSDVTVAPHHLLWLARHLADPGLALVAPRIAGDGRATSRLGAYEAARSSLDLGPDGGLVRPRTRLGWVPAACVVARVAALSDGFDAAMRSGEDVDLVWRLTGAGWRVRYEPGAIAEHRHREAPLAWAARKAFYGASGGPLATRHGGHVAPAAMSPLGAAVALAALSGCRWSAPVALGLAAVMAWRLTDAVSSSRLPDAVAVEVTALGLAAVGEQTIALLLRHWWPLTALACTVSRHARRLALAATLVDAALEYHRRAPRLGAVTFTLLRRADDLAYGAGLWIGAARAWSLRALLPRIGTSS